MPVWHCGVPVDPDRDQARQWLQSELDRPGYSVERSFVSRVWEWITGHLPSLDLPGTLPPWAAWAALALILLAGLAVITFVSRDRWRRASLSLQPATGAVLEEEGLRATDYRARAVAALLAGQPGAALVDAYRALTASSIERSLLDDRPGRTAHEVAVDLSSVFPDAALDLARAAEHFDEVRYGAHDASREQASAVLALEEQISRSRPAFGALP